MGSIFQRCIQQEENSDERCGTAAGCIGLSEIDFLVIGDGKTGPVTHSIQNGYHDLIWRKVGQYEEWGDYVEERVKV